MIAPQEAWDRIETRLAPLAGETVPRREASGRVLSAALAATADLPACDVSAMDGYAVAGAVTAGEERPVDGVIAAGDRPGRRLAPGASVRIMTGAPVPEGADTVIPVEHTDGGVERVVFCREGRLGANVRRRGEVLTRGRVLLEAGDPLTPGALALLATHGYGEVPVRRRPRLAILATGDEVVPPDIEPRPGQLRDSHTDFLLAASRRLGLEPHALGIAPDRVDVLRERIKTGIRHDVLLVCGGVSMGEFDFVEEVLDEIGCEVLFDAVAVQPGKPLVAARHADGWVFGLPGNPASVMVCYWLFVRPLLRVLAGGHDRFWGGSLRGTLLAPLPAAKDRDRFLPAHVTLEDGRARVTPINPRGSHDLAAYARGNALVRVPAHAGEASPGEPCSLLPLSGGLAT